MQSWSGLISKVYIYIKYYIRYGFFVLTNNNKYPDEIYKQTEQ